MAAVQFILSVIMAICAVAMFLSAVFIHANPSMVVSALLFHHLLWCIFIGKNQLQRT